MRAGANGVLYAEWDAVCVVGFRSGDLGMAYESVSYWINQLFLAYECKLSPVFS